MDKKNLMEWLAEILNSAHGPLYMVLLAICVVFGLDAIIQAGYSYTANGVTLTPGKPDPDTEEADEAE